MESCSFLAYLAQRAMWSFVITLHPSSSSVSSSASNIFLLSSSSMKPLNRFGPNLAEMFIGRFWFVILVQIGNPTWLPGPIMCSDWLKLWKSSCQKLLSRWNCNIIEMMTGWSSTKFVIFVPIAYPRWPPQGNNSLLLDPMRISFKDLFLRNFYKPLGLEIKRFWLSKFQNISQVIDIEYLLGHGHFILQRT